MKWKNGKNKLKPELKTQKNKVFTSLKSPHFAGHETRKSNVDKSKDNALFGSGKRLPSHLALIALTIVFVTVIIIAFAFISTVFAFTGESTNYGIVASIGDGGGNSSSTKL